MVEVGNWGRCENRGQTAALSPPAHARAPPSARRALNAPVGQGPEPSGVKEPRGQKKPAKQGCGVEKFLASEMFVATPVRQK